MPPSDSWLASRRFGIVIDAGSSGSRLLIYSWKDVQATRSEEWEEVYFSLPKVEKGTRDISEWVKKVEPGISSFAQSPDDVASYLAPLLEHAYAQVPPSLQPETPLFLYATAGMRLLSDHQQAALIKASCDFLKFHSNFRIDEPSYEGPCGSSIRIITGEEEGLFGWIAVNYLTDGFRINDSGSAQTTYGFLDMGGASTQIAFEPNAEERERTKHLQHITLRLIGGRELHYSVFVTTWLGYGTNKARERYLESIISQHSDNVVPSSSEPELTIMDPCLPKDLIMFESSGMGLKGASQLEKDYRVVGSGSFEDCLRQVAPLLNKEAPCVDAPCLFNGVYVPRIDFSASHFIGVSEYWYSTEDLFGLGGAYDFVRYEEAASRYCGREWPDILQDHERSKEQGRLGGDGELEIGGKVIATDTWDEDVALPRLQMQCFKSAWLVNVLHDGIGLPRIVDPGGDIDSNEKQYLEQKAREKGLGRPIFQSLKSVGGTAISWTLGKIVLEASQEVPPLDEAPSKALSHRPAPDLSSSVLPPALDISVDQYQSKLPPLFMRLNNHASFFKLSFYVIVLCILLLAISRIRRRVLMLARSIMNKLSRLNNHNNYEVFSLEEGSLRQNSVSNYPNTRPSSPDPVLSSRWFSSVRRFISRSLSRRSSVVVMSPRAATPWHTTYNNQSYRSFSSPASKYQNGYGHSDEIDSTLILSNSSTPQVMSRNSSLNSNAGNQSLYSLSRSRNSSQLNLTTLVPRQALSRAGNIGTAE